MNVCDTNYVDVRIDACIYGSVESTGHVEIGENTVVKGVLHSKSSIVLDRFARVHGR